MNIQINLDTLLSVTIYIYFTFYVVTNKWYKIKIILLMSINQYVF